MTEFLAGFDVVEQFDRGNQKSGTNCAAAVQVEKEVSTCDDQIAETKGDHFRCTAIGSAGKHTGKIPLVERAGARTIPKSRRIRNRYGDERPGHRCRI